MMALSRGESLQPTYDQSSNFRKEPRTFGRRARQRHTETSRIHETRRRRDPALRPRETSFCWCRDAPATGLLSFPHSLYRDPRQLCHVQHQTLEPGLCSPDTAPSPPAPPAYHHQRSPILAHIGQFLSWDGRDHFDKFQLIEDRGLTTCIKPNHQDHHLGLASHHPRTRT